MRHLYFATQRESKVNSLKRELERLPNWGVLTIPFDVPEPRGENVKEIALAKVGYAQKFITKTGVIALDAGFYIDALDGFPGAMVNHILKNTTLGVEAFLKLMCGVKTRSCRFTECLAFLDPKLTRRPICFEAEIPGTLAEEQRGDFRPDQHWSQLATIFIPKNESKTLAEMSEAEYEKWRTIREKSAMKLFVDWLSQF
ncbi:MAG: hypothetical protein HYW89_04795 [Candidatus Sungiibacteriota bacterium]|uniref:Non-canonical purine NTP pyrophosphatase n=1 Tax=Candidatus Sungiibacteriota bacterium TaxID=2750080 RepID=A0A7T5RJK0_9BACT|nr:MAG: hypothetical protein HYW89_04795 [Candidatus Sungbacteria bacterium]